jgi:F-type H+-transporting ATPase subunit a
MSCLLEIGAGLLIILTLNAEQHNLHRMTMYPSINHMVGEMLYKTGFMLLVSTLGKEIESREFFIKVKTIFVFLIITNLQGMIPYTGTITSSLANTFYIALALFISILMTIKEKKGLAYFLNLFMPPGCPINLIFLLIPIEVISYSFRVVSLSVRLFANMMAGHTLLKVIVGFS